MDRKLPAARTSPRRKTAAAKAKSAAPARTPRTPPVPAPRARALVVEDEAPRRLAAAALIAIAVLAAWLAGVPGAARRPARAWHGYEVLLIRPDVARAGGLQKIVTALGPGVVCELTATVDFWDFTGVQRIPVGLIDARIDPSDPRHDKTMDALPGYFRVPPGRAGAWSIAYIPTRRAAVMESAAIAAALGLPFRGEWRLAGSDALEGLVSAAGLLAVAALLAWPSRRESRARLLVASAGCLAWIPFVLAGGPERVALALLLYAAWLQVIDVFVELRGSEEKLLRGVRQPLARFLAAAGAGFVLTFLAGGSSSAAAAGLAGPVVSCLLLVTAMGLLEGRAPRARRKKFDPVPIMKNGVSRLRPGQAAFLLVFVVTLAVAAVELARSAAVPTPVPLTAARGYTWDSLARLSRQRDAARLPDLSDLVTHEAFQQTLAFGRPWKLPSRDERVYVRGFSVNPGDGTIVEAPRRVKVFDTAWMDSVTRQGPAGSIERMLIDQGPVSVTYQGQAGTLLREFPLAVLVLFVFSAWFVRERRPAPLMKGVLVRLNGPARRNQVP